MQQKLPYTGSFIGINLLAAIIVYVAKVSLIGSLVPVAGIGTKGSQIFYFISARTLFLFFNNKKNERYSNKVFFISRVSEIVLLHYLCTVLLSIIFHLYPSSKVETAEYLLLSYLLILPITTSTSLITFNYLRKF